MCPNISFTQFTIQTKHNKDLQDGVSVEIRETYSSDKSSYAGHNDVELGSSLNLMNQKQGQ